MQNPWFNPQSVLEMCAQELLERSHLVEVFRKKLLPIHAQHVRGLSQGYGMLEAGKPIDALYQIRSISSVQLLREDSIGNS
ncbi:MAG: hypothetical protein ACOY3I_02995 [Verrucomicrobiota bacterium]